MATVTWLRTSAERARLMRRDTAGILTRLFYLERSLILSQAGWLPAVERLEAKAALARALWEDGLAGAALRERVFELRYPSRALAAGDHQAVIAAFDAARAAPSAEAFLLGLAEALVPALRDAYAAFAGLADGLTDGPSAYLLRHRLSDKAAQVPDLAAAARQALDDHPERRPAAEAWTAALAARLAALGPLLDVPDGLAADAAPLPGARPLAVAVVPGRDPRFRRARFYWPHIVDPAFPSAEGVALQLRSAVGHLNEVWAIEISAANLYHFADELGWDFIYELARWTYDESRHCLMGYQRLREWGFEAADLPLGDYIYVAAREAGDPLYGLGMIFYFETKYIHRGRARINTFRENADEVSRHDYEFDWADETFHAEYGKRWLTELLARRQSGPRDLNALRAECAALVDARVATATDEERAEIHRWAAELMAGAEQRARA